jgi:hypothetical protein
LAIIGCYGWKYQQTVISEEEGSKVKVTAPYRTFVTGKQRALVKSEVFLSNAKKFSSCLICNTVISTTKRNQLMLFIVIVI